MDPESTPELDAQFAAGFEDADTASTVPASETADPAPAGDAGDQPQDNAPAPDPLASIRAELDELRALRKLADTVPTLEKRLRTAEGRVGDLFGRIPAPPPPAPPRLEKVERLKDDFPEAVDAIEELLEHRLKGLKPQADAEQAEKTGNVAYFPEQTDDGDVATPILDAEAPGWEEKLVSPQFGAWLNKQGDAYAAKVKGANSEAVVLAAIAKFDAWRESAAAQPQPNAQPQRTNRAAAAAVPNTAGRRAPVESTLDDAFEAGFRGT